MTEQELKNMLLKVLPEGIESVAFEEATWSDQGDGKNNLSPRDNLLSIFKRRLRILNKKEAIYNDVSGFVRSLESLPIQCHLYSWTCCTETQRWVGWATDEKIIYKIQSSSKNPI